MLPAARVPADVVAGADLIVVGGPTHVHGMSRPSTRKNAAEMARKPGSTLTLEPDAAGPALSDWFGSLGRQMKVPAAAFDTRVAGPAMLTGRACLGIQRQLRRHGFGVFAPPKSFLVSGNKLREGETEQARWWGRDLASTLDASSAAAADHA